MIEVHKAAAGTTSKRAKVDLSVAATRARAEAYLRKNQRMIESWWDISVDDDPAAAAALAAGGAMVGPRATKKADKKADKKAKNLEELSIAEGRPALSR